jgi:hypothetical protein
MVWFSIVARNSPRTMLESKMTKNKARWWLESIVRNHGGSLHREALSIIFAEQGESRPTVRAKTPRATKQGRLEDSAQICPKCSGRGSCDKSRNGNLEYGTCDKCGGSGKLLPC